MEEDIKILEEMKQNCLTKREYVDPKAERKAQALENIIKGYREKEESEKYLYDAYQDAGKKMFEYAEQLEDSVPKSKVKEKIEEYQKLIKEAQYNEEYYNEIPLYEHDIEVLQELLEDK